MEFRILGPLEVEDSGRSVPVGRGRQRALLALLLLHANEVVAQDRLIDELWGSEPPETAAKSLHNHVSALRRALGGDTILTRPPGYVVELDGDALDATRFERLVEEGRGAGDAGVAGERFRAALGLWRGPPLQEFSSEEFAQAEIRRLEELRLVALEGRIDADLALGGGSELVPELEALVSEHPLRERLRGQLMLALYRSGRQADALEAYRDARTTLMDELGLEPGTELQELERRILRQDPALDAPVDARRPAQAAPSRPPRRWIAVGATALLLAVIAAVAVVLTRGDKAVAVVPNSIAKIDPETQEIVDVFPVGGDPFKPAVVGEYVFVSNERDETFSRIDIRSGEVDTFGGLTSPAGISSGADGTLWLGSFHGGEVRQVRARDLQLLTRLDGLEEFSSPWLIAVGASSVWVSQNGPSAVSRFDARTGKLQRTYELDFRDVAGDIAFGDGAAWSTVFDIHAVPGAVLRIEARGRGTTRIAVGIFPAGIAFGFGAVWVADLGDDDVKRIDARTEQVEETIPVGRAPLSVVTGGGSVWVSNRASPRSRRSTRRRTRS